MAKFKDLKKLRKPARLTVMVQLDGTLQQRENDLRRAIASARQAETMAGADLSQGPPASVIDMEQELEDLRLAGDTTTAPFTFEACGFAALEELRYKHPPSDTQREAEGLQWDPDTFGPALMALCAVEPELTESEAAEIWETWSPGLVNTLYRAAWDVCNSNPVVRPLLNPTSVQTLRSGQQLVTALAEESQGAGS
jgi:hypothetical protein